MKKVYIYIFVMVIINSLLVSAEEDSRKELVDILKNEYSLSESDKALYDFIDYYNLDLENIMDANIPYLAEDFFEDYETNYKTEEPFIETSEISDHIDINNLAKIEYIVNDNSDYYILAIDFINNIKYKGQANALINIEYADSEIITDKEASEIIDKLSAFHLEKWKEDYSSNDEDEYSTGWYSWTVLLADTDNNVQIKGGSGTNLTESPSNYQEFDTYIWNIMDTIE